MSGRDPSSHLYLRGRTWWFRAKSRRQGDVRFSLRTHDRELAARRAKDELDRLNREDWGDVRHTWKEAVGRWLTEVATRGLKPRSIERYRSSIATLHPILGGLHLDEIDKKVVVRIASRTKVTNATKKRDLTAVASVLRAAESWGWIETNPIRLYDRSFLRERREPIVLPTEADIQKLCQRAPAVLAAAVRILQYTGMRVDELRTLLWRQVDLRRRAVTLLHTKSGKPRVVPLDERALAAFQAAPRRLDCPWVIWRDHGEPGPYASLDSSLYECRKAARVPFRTHDLRHLYAVTYLQEGGSLYDLQKILGHSSLTTTEMYLVFLTPEEAQHAKRGSHAG